MVSARKRISFRIPSVSFLSGTIVSIISFYLLRITFESTQTSNSVKIVSIPLGGRLAWLRARIRFFMVGLLTLIGKKKFLKFDGFGKKFGYWEKSLRGSGFSRESERIDSREVV